MNKPTADMKALRTAADLRAARERIAHGWTQGAFARDAAGNVTEDKRPDAVCFCALGALQLDWYSDQPSVEALANAVEVVPVGCSPLTIISPFTIVSHFNDLPTTTQADVLALFDRAIVACE
jgi:hypothetical protein